MQTRTDELAGLFSVPELLATVAVWVWSPFDEVVIVALDQSLSPIDGRKSL
jgi:hypothetical protein